MHDRARRHRGLTAADGTLIGEGLGLQEPGSPLATGQANPSGQWRSKTYSAHAFSVANPWGSRTSRDIIQGKITSV